MEKNLFYLIIIILFIGCTNHNKKDDFAFSGKSFTLYLKNSKGEEIIEFQDSTYSTLGINSNLNIGSLSNPESWKISYYENTPFLTFNHNSLGIKKINDSTYCMYPINNINDSIIMRSRKSKWNRNILNGKWEERNNNKGEETNHYYELNDSTISHSLYLPNTTKILVNNTNEIIEIGNYIGRSEYAWLIKNINDSLMVIDKLILDSTSNNIEWTKNIELVKKR
jgi:hypothetical protein